MLQIRMWVKIISGASWLTAIAVSVAVHAAETSDSKTFTQMPEVQRSTTASTPAVTRSRQTAEESAFQVLPGFQVEKLFTVPKEELGSWVAIAFDQKGRLLASDQGNQGLCRITPAPMGSNEPTKV